MTYHFKNFAISAEYTGGKPAEWSHGTNWNHHKVTVKNTENGKRTSFDFWASITSPRLKTECDVLNAFYCFVSDAIDGLESFEGFCSELGYDTDSRKSERAWKSCKRAAEKLERIAGGADFYDLCNELLMVGA